MFQVNVQTTGGQASVRQPSSLGAPRPLILGGDPRVLQPLCQRTWETSPAGQRSSWSEQRVGRRPVSGKETSGKSLASGASQRSGEGACGGNQCFPKGVGRGLVEETSVFPMNAAGLFVWSWAVVPGPGLVTCPRRGPCHGLSSHLLRPVWAEG